MGETIISIPIISGKHEDWDVFKPNSKINPVERKKQLDNIPKEATPNSDDVANEVGFSDAFPNIDLKK